MKYAPEILLVCLVVVILLAIVGIRDRGRCLQMGPDVQHTYFIGSLQLDSASYAQCQQWERP